MGARGGGYPWLDPSPATPTDTCSRQQILCGEGRQRVHCLWWRQSRQLVTQVSSPTAEVLAVVSVDEAMVA